MGTYTLQQTDRLPLAELKNIAKCAKSISTSQTCQWGIGLDKGFEGAVQGSPIQIKTVAFCDVIRPVVG